MTNKKAWRISIAASILLVAGVFIALFGAGLHLYIVKTPSMGTTAPVGTLVVVHAKDSYAIGDVVSYARNGVVYTHRIVDVTARGFITKGDINGSPDALPVSRSEIVGTVTFYGKDLGFVVEAMPWLLIGGAIVYGLSLIPRIGRSWRWHFRLVGWSLVTSLVALWFRPWVNMVMTGSVTHNDGVDMHLVNTGIFPVSVLGKVLTSGQDAVVTQKVADASGHYVVIPQLALNSWYFVLLLAICLTPVLASLLIGVEQEVPAVIAEPAETPRRLRPQYRRIAPIALTVTATIFAVALVLQMSTNAAFAASINNSTNTAGTNRWFTCRNAETGTATARFVWPLSATSNIGTRWNPLYTTDDVKGGLDGTVYGQNPSVVDLTKSPNPACPRDTPPTALNFAGATCITQTTAVSAPKDYSIEVWFNTSTRANGKLIGFGDSTTATDGKYDRHLYIDSTGRLIFGTYDRTDNTQHVIVTPTSYADGAWHNAVATSTAAGALAFYVDGALVGTTTITHQDVYTGYWKVGCGNLNTWQDATTTWVSNWPNYFTGQLAFAAVYDRALTEPQAKEHYLAGRI